MESKPLNMRERALLRLLWREGPISRWEIHEQTALHPNLVGAAIAQLQRQRIVCQMKRTSRGTGRPRIPLDIDPQQRSSAGLSIAPGRVQAVRLNLRGEPLAPAFDRRIRRPHELLAAARELLKRVIDGSTLAVGVSVTGFVDPQSWTILFSSAAPSRAPLLLRPLFEEVARMHPNAGAPGQSPVLMVLENDMHALSARWLLTTRTDPRDDILLVGLDDGRLGASILINGRPNRGCVVAANELGHLRLAVKTDRCYCGRSGCLERIFSQAFLRTLGVPKAMTIADLLRCPAAHARSRRRFVDLVAMGLANAVNFVRPSRLVIVGPHVQQLKGGAGLESAIRAATLVEIEKRLVIDWWDQTCVQSAINAGWLGLAALYHDGWTAVTDQAVASS